MLSAEMKRLVNPYLSHLFVLQWGSASTGTIVHVVGEEGGGDWQLRENMLLNKTATY